MRHLDSIFAGLLKPLDRRAFKASARRHDADAYCKSFDSWGHLVALIYAQLGGIGSLRELIAGWNANAHHHYHLGGGAIARSTLADANARRPVAVFADAFERLSAQLDRRSRSDGEAMLRLIDATPIPLGRLCKFAAWNGRIRGLKMHLVYDPHADRPHGLDITPANVNDIEIGRATPLEKGATYVFDKAYCHYGWWASIAGAGAYFVTRPKHTARWRAIELRPLGETAGDGFRIIGDCAVALASKGDSKLPIRLRRIAVERDDAKAITLITNDMRRPAVEIAALYKARWQIELLFRWIKQHLEIKTFLGRNDNAIRLQIVAAMIAFALLRIAARLHRIHLPPLRLAQLAGSCLFVRKPLASIDKPPPLNPSRHPPISSPNQWEFSYA
ncbi:MAG: IS4 family transposase [Rhodospirillales bacterium]|nr:IS4 family transposase [Rhodospirillales bacterium]